MNTYRERLEAGLGAWGRFLFRHRAKTLVIMGVLIVLLSARLHTMQIDMSTEGFFHETDPAKLTYDRFRTQFGREDVVMVLVRPPEVFDREFLARLREFHRALESGVPYLEKVTSLVNVRRIRAKGDVLIVDELLQELPATPAAMAAFKERVLSSPLYPNFLISEDGRSTALLLETLAYSPGPGQDALGAGFEEQGGDAEAPAKRIYLTNDENAELVRAVRRVGAEFRRPEFQVHIAGAPVWGDFLIDAMPRDMGRFITLALLTIGAFLYVLFRRVSGVVLPLGVVVLSLLSTLGLMVWLGKSFTIPTAILPSFLLAVGVGDSVHVLAIFYRHFDESGAKLNALAFALEHSALPIVMTSLTTAAGLLAFFTAELAPVSDLGLFGSLGVMICLLYTLVLIPALIAVWPMRPRAPRTGGHYGRRIDAVLRGIAAFATTRPWRIALLSALVVILAVIGLPRLRFSHDPIRWIPRSTDMRQAIDLIDRELNGSSTVEVVLDTGQENGLYDPAFMRDIESLVGYASRYRNSEGEVLVGKANSVLDVLKETHRVLNGDDPRYYAIPEQRRLIAQELLLFESSGGDDLEKLVDSRFSLARVSLKVHNEDAARFVQFVGDVETEAVRLFGPDTAVTVTGIMKLFAGIVDNLMRSMVRSYSIAFVFIAVMMILLLTHFRIGLLSMLPNLGPILVTLGMMGWLGIALDGFTLLIGSIALGLAVDDTIHFFHNFRRYYRETRDTATSVRRTLETSGRAMLFTTLVLVTGFWLFMLASLNNVFYFGLLTGTTLIVALLGDFLLAPAILELISRTRSGARMFQRWCGQE